MTPTAPQTRPHVLVVDDNELNRRLLATQLSRHGYSATEAGSGHQALALIAGQNFDVILLDIRMPGMDGLEALDKIRQIYSLLQLPVIMVTAENQEQSLIEALEKGANDYIVKPVNIAVATARVKTQLTLKRLAQLKEEFLRFASHDLKKPLLGLQDMAETLDRECRPGAPISEDSRDVLHLMQRTVGTMQSVIDGFLQNQTLGGARTTPGASVDVNGLLTELVAGNQHYAGRKGIRLTFTPAATPCTVAADPFFLNQIMENLIGNALKFSPPHTQTEVRVRCAEGFAHLEVCDEGPGILATEMDRLFTKHAGISNPPTGGENSTGIGLAMVKQLTDTLGGQITALNNPERGMTFRVSLKTFREIESS